MNNFETYQKVHGNKKIKLAGKKYRVSELKKMTNDELNNLWKEVEGLIGPDLDTLWFKYSENLLLKEQGLPYGTDLLKNNEDNENGYKI